MNLKEFRERQKGGDYDRGPPPEGDRDRLDSLLPLAQKKRGRDMACSNFPSALGLRNFRHAILVRGLMSHSQLRRAKKCSLMSHLPFKITRTKKLPRLRERQGRGRSDSRDRAGSRGRDDRPPRSEPSV